MDNLILSIHISANDYKLVSMIFFNNNINFYLLKSLNQKKLPIHKNLNLSH